MSVRRFLLTAFILGSFAVLLSACGCAQTVEPTAAPTLAIHPQETNSGPQIIAQTPLAGQRLDLLTKITLVFDRGMNPQTTSAAWTFLDANGASISGASVWIDSRTFQFTPANKLLPGSDYVGVFSMTASDVQGTTLAAELRLKFRTVDALAAGQVFPVDGAQDVDPATNIAITFNVPVVPLTAADAGSLPQPLLFDPPVSGQGQWVNTSMYIFQPEGILESGTSYEVQLAPGLSDASGNEMAGAFAWRFTTRRVSGQVQSANFEKILLDQALTIRFLQPMDPESVSRAISVVNRETAQAVPLQLKWSANNTLLEIKPGGLYKIASFYRLRVAETARAKDGHALSAPIQQDFSTVPFPRIEKVAPDPNSKASSFNPSLTIQFSSPMYLASLKSRVVVSPKPEKENWNYNSYNNQLTISGLDPATDYIVRVLPGATDIYGNGINSEYSFKFSTAALSPYARLLTPRTPLAYRAQAAKGMFFEYINLKSADIQIYPISFAEFFTLTGPKADANNFQPRTESIRRWQPDVKAVQNRLVRTNLDFQSAGSTALAPGYYFIGLKASPLKSTSRYQQGAAFMVATDTLTLKTTTSESLAWLVDLETGQPTPDIPIVIYDDTFHEIGRSRTDSSGLAYLSGLVKPRYARTDDDTRLAFAAQDWGSGVSAYQFGIWSNYYTDASSQFVYAYTERPLYRPGQDVFFSGILRQNDDLHYSLLAQENIYITITQDGEQVFAQSVPVSDLGTFTGTFHLDEGASLGTYTLSVFDAPADKQSIGGVSFRVADYHKPEFQVQSSASPADVLVGNPFRFEANANYYSGGKVGRADVAWRMESSPFYFIPSENYLRYSFSDWDRDSYWSDPAAQTPVTVEEGKGTTDENGLFTVTRTASLGKSATSRLVRFFANTTDLAGNVVAVHSDLVVHQSEAYVGIRADQYIGAQGQAQNFSLVALDWDSRPVSGQSVSVDIAERRWYSVQQQDAKGQVQWVTSVKDIPTAHFDHVVTDSEGKASVSFTPAAGGIYKAVASVRDSKNHTQRSSTFLWVSSAGYVPWRQTNDRSFNLVSDKDAYAPGDTAELLIAQQFSGPVYALVTVERGHVYKQDVIRLEGNSTIYRLPVTADMAPAAYVSVTVIRGAGASGRPDFKVGMARINVSTDQQKLSVAIRADTPSAGPGDRVTYTVDVKDAAGKPATAEVSFALVDKAVLALVPSNVTALLQAFYPLRALSVSTAVGLVASADDFNARYKETPPMGENSGGGGGGEKGVGEEGIVTVRENFRDTAYYRAQVKTDANGTARVTVALPENLTTWQMAVRAVTADSLVGEATHELLSTKALFIQLQTPRFFVSGDTARIGATVFNNGTGALDADVSLDAQGVDLLTDRSQKVTVAGQKQMYVTWDVRAIPGAVRADLTAHTTSGVFSDSSKPPLGTLSEQGIPIYAFHTRQTAGTSGLLTRADSRTEAVTLPSSFDDAKLILELSPSLAASLKPGISYLQDFPYGCMEQTTSRLFSDVLDRRLWKMTGNEDATALRALDRQAGNALQRIYSQQNPDGGWGWWGGESNLQTSAYVVYVLAEASKAGYPASAKVQSSGVDYIRQHMPTLNEQSEAWEFNRQAFLVYVMARAGAKEADDAFTLYESRDKLAVYSKAYLAQAIALLNPKDSRIATLNSDLAAAAVSSAAGSHWEEKDADLWNWNSDLRTTAIVLNALIQIDPTHPMAANAARWLMSLRSSGGWGSTQENAWTLLALTNWLESSKEYQADYHYAVGWNDRLLREGDANRGNLSETIHEEITRAQMLTGQKNFLVIARGEGAGNLYYTAYLDVTLPVVQVQPLNQGIIVSRQYFRLDNDKQPITEIKRGELVRVRITVNAPASLHYVVVNDALPAGLEPVDASLLTDVQVPRAYTYQDYLKHGWGWWFFNHIERRDEKVVYSADNLPPGTYVLTYYARASTAGTFQVLPIAANEFYFADVAGRGAGSEFTVRP
jgi:alpha-2-macroglobulin